MTLDEAIRRNPYDQKRGNRSAYCRYLRYNVDGWYQLNTKEVLRRWQKVRKQMQIVISIEDEFYDYIKEQVKDGITNPLKVAIVNGKILPKGHGKLIDADKLYSDYVREQEEFKSGRSLMNLFREAPTIIEADRSEEE